MSVCLHLDLMKICEITNNDKRVKEFICEACLVIFQPCIADEQFPRTPDHISSCEQCSSRKKKSKFRVVKEGWQEQLLELGNQARVEEKQKKRAVRA